MDARMANKRRPQVRAAELCGLKYFKILGPLLDGLHEQATARGQAGNRSLFFDQYASLLLLYFFNPIVTSLRGIQQASTLDKVQKLLGCGRVSLGSLSEASRVFDAQALHWADECPECFNGFGLARFLRLCCAFATGGLR